MGQNRAQSQVFCHFFMFGSLVFLEMAQDDSLKHCLLLVEVKSMKKFQGAHMGFEIRGVFCHSLRFASLVFLDIAQDCSLGPCLTSIKTKTFKKIYCGQNRAEMIFSILMSSSVHSNFPVFQLHLDECCFFRIFLRMLDDKIFFLK